MYYLDDILEFIFKIWWVILLLTFLFFLFILFYDWFTWKSCYAKYENAKYDFWWWCLIEYKWEFIPDELYEKAFEENLILDIKRN